MVRPSKSFKSPSHFPLVSNFDPSRLVPRFPPPLRKIRGGKGGDDMCIEANVYIFPHLVVKSNKERREERRKRHEGSYFSPCLPLVDRWQIGAANFTRLPRKFQTARERDSNSSGILS